MIMRNQEVDLNSNLNCELQCHQIAQSNRIIIEFEHLLIVTPKIGVNFLTNLKWQESIVLKWKESIVFGGNVVTFSDISTSRSGRGWLGSAICRVVYGAADNLFSSPHITDFKVSGPYCNDLLCHVAYLILCFGEEEFLKLVPHCNGAMCPYQKSFVFWYHLILVHTRWATVVLTRLSDALKLNMLVPICHTTSPKSAWNSVSVSSVFSSIGHMMRISRSM